MKTAAAAAGLVLLVVAIYAQAGANAFVNFDDDTYVTRNPHVLAGWTAPGVRWAFTTTTGSNYHPVTWLSHMTDAQLFGAKPAGHHWTSVLLHAANAALLFLALRALTGCFARSWVVAALFAVHPLRVESVAWVSERKDLLAGFFWIAALLAYAWHARRPGAARYAVVFACVAIGLLAKPMLVTLPFVLLLLDFWPLGRWRTAGAKTLILEKLPLVALAAGSSFVTFAVQSSTGATRTAEAVPLVARLVNAASSYVLYLVKTVVPAGLAIFYPHPFLVEGKLSTITVAAGAIAGAAVAGATAALLRAPGRRPWLTTGWLWYLGTLVPVIGLVQVGEQARADRYAYLPLVGIYLAVTWAAAEWIEAKPRFRTLAVAMIVCSVVAFGALTRRQVATWKDSETLFRHALAVAPSALAHNNLGLALEEKGRRADAIADYEAALRLRPGFAPALNNLGAALRLEGRLADAESSLRRALALRPDYVEALVNLGTVLQAEGRPSDARQSYERALSIRPESPEALVALGTLFGRQGDLASSEAKFRAAIRIDPARIEARKNLGIVLMSQGRLQEAVAEYEAALSLRPDDPDLLADSGVLLARSGRREEAIARLERALQIKPGHAGARAALSELRGIR